jgi:hypothetical protein
MVRFEEPVFPITKRRRRVVAVSTTTILRRLRKIKDQFSADSAERKVALLRELDGRRLEKAVDVYHLHEVISFLHAYPDDRRVRMLAQRMLKRFSRRADLQRFAGALADSGIEGTPTRYSFYWATASWIEKKWPGHLTIDWKAFEKGDELWGVLYNLLPFTESLALDEANLKPRELLGCLKGPGETDAGFLIRRFSKSLKDEDSREMVYEDLDIPCTLSPGPGTPARTGARYKPSPVVYQTGPLDRRRPDLKKEVRIEPKSVRPVPPGEGRKLIEMARKAMVARSRDLYAFQHGDANDVRMVEFEDGLQFAAIGMRPEQRLMLDTVYGFLTLKSGIPIGYVLTRSYFNSSEVAYNVFDTFRGGEAARIYGRVLAMTRHLFGADAFTIDPYQMGHQNPEGLKSGAWWFYYKLGFRPFDPEVKKLLRAELARMRRSSKQRSSIATLNKLSSKNMFYYLGRERHDVRGLISLENIGLAVSRYLALRFGAERERGERVCEKEAAGLLGVGSFGGFSKGERLTWRRWSPLIMALPRVERWSPEEKRALAEVARAKGGKRETDYMRLFNAHRKLRRALLVLAGGDYDPV